MDPVPCDAVVPAEVWALVASSSQPPDYYVLRDALRTSRGGRLLTSTESAVISAVVRSAQATAAFAEAERVRTERDAGATFSPSSILLCTAYSSDYSIGRLCEAVNRQYAARHGYRFESVVLPYSEMLEAVAPRAHPTWYKVLLLRRLLSEAAAQGVTWIMWLDADAIVVEQETRILEDIVSAAHGRELIVAEDMHVGCLLNAGVLLVRACAWSEAMWADVWEERRYWGVPYYEQASLVAVLRTRLEGLETVRPFHSFTSGGPQGPKLFAHVAVLPTLDFNSNRWERGAAASDRAVEEGGDRSPTTGLGGHSHGSTSEGRDTIDGTDDSPGADAAGLRARFIFHPAGGNKLAALLRVVGDCGITVPPAVVPDEFRLFRRSHGRMPKEAAAEAAAAAALRRVQGAPVRAPE